MRIPPGLSTLIHRSSSGVKPALASLRLGAYRQGYLRGLPIRIRHREGYPCFGIEKSEGGGVAVIMDRNKLSFDRGTFSTLWKRAGVFVDLISDRAIAPGVYRCDFWDSCEEPGPILTFCSNIPENILVPDRGFYLKRGYAQARRQAADALPWSSRSDIVLWRGNHTGRGLAATSTMRTDDASLIQRARMCLLARAIPGADLKFAVSSHYPPALRDAYASTGIAGGPIPAVEWTRRKFAMDVDGNANAYSNLYIRLLYGCCVLKVASPFGYRQWYYDRLKPWTHYVPVEADLSDLEEKIAWCRDNDDACQAIAASGQRLAFSMTVETERRSAVLRINAAFQR